MSDQKQSFWNGDIAVAISMGDFVSLLIDGGHDQVVTRILERKEYEDGDDFRLKMEINLIPENRLVEFMAEQGVEHTLGRMNRMIALLEGGERVKIIDE